MSDGQLALWKSGIRSLISQQLFKADLTMDLRSNRRTVKYSGGDGDTFVVSSAALSQEQRISEQRQESHLPTPESKVNRTPEQKQEENVPPTKSKENRTPEQKQGQQQWIPERKKKKRTRTSELTQENRAGTWKRMKHEIEELRGSIIIKIRNGVILQPKSVQPESVISESVPPEPIEQFETLTPENFRQSETWKRFLRLRKSIPEKDELGIGIGESDPEYIEDDERACDFRDENIGTSIVQEGVPFPLEMSGVQETSSAAAENLLGIMSALAFQRKPKKCDERPHGLQLDKETCISRTGLHETTDAVKNLLNIMDGTPSFHVQGKD